MKKFRRLLFVSGLLIVAPAQIAPASDAEACEPLVLSKMGVMFVGGHMTPMQGGGFGAAGAQTQIVAQAPVHFLIPSQEKRGDRPPVVMVPGMGLTSYLYLGTPDGREGWAQIFARVGYPVYVFDEPNNAIAGFDVGPFNASPYSQRETGDSPGFMLWSNETVWRRWGIGPQPGVPFEDTLYPTEHIWQLYSSLTPVCRARGAHADQAQHSTEFAKDRVPSRGRPTTSAEQAPSARPRGRRARAVAAGSTGFGGRRRMAAFTDEAMSQKRQRQTPIAVATQQAPPVPAGRANGGGRQRRRFGAETKAEALVALLEEIGPSVLVLHSASGSTGFEATRMRPDLVTAIVAVEVVGTPTDSGDIRRHFSDKRFIGLFGDHFESRRMAGRYEASKNTVRLINEAGGKAETIRLPELGIRGNSHLMMQDTNNRRIAQMILERLTER